jgi:putative iron-dependent peroxidase
MPFGQPGHGEFGTYFIGYCRTPRTTEQMLENMFIGRPPGNYDRLLDFSRAVTGTLFFAPATSFLDGIAAGGMPASPIGEAGAEPRAQPISSMRDGSLGIGTLKGKPQR